MSNYISKGGKVVRRLMPEPTVYTGDLQSEDEKLNVDYLVAQAESAIRNVIREKYDILKAKRLYDQRRDEEEFAFLRNTYGIENPIDLKFRSLVRPHVQAIKGLVLSDPMNYNITSNNTFTTNEIEEEKKASMLEEYEELLGTLKGLPEDKMKTLIDSFHAELARKYNNSWVSSLEIIAQFIIDWLKMDPDTDLRNKLGDLIEDLCVTGTCYYRVWVKRDGEKPSFDVINPLNIFYNKNYNERFVKNCDKIVRREFMTKSQVLNEYGHFLNDEAKEILFSQDYTSTFGTMVFSNEDLRYFISSPTVGYYQYTQYNGNFDMQRIIDVYHVEWIANNEVEITDPEEIERLATVEEKKSKPKKIIRYRKDRYEATRIGGYIYVNMGKSKFINRNIDDSFDCCLTYNGIELGNNGVPYSLILKTKDIQDLYDILSYFRDNLIAVSGTRGSRVNVHELPDFLGNTMAERIMSYITYKKQGVELIAKEISENPQSGFAHYGDFDNTLRGDGIMAINAVLATLREEVSMHTGVTPQMLAQIEAREAVSNVKQGLYQASMLTKPLFESHRTIANNILMDYLNAYRMSFSGSKLINYITPTGSTKILEINTNNVSLCSFNIGLIDPNSNKQELETLKSLAAELIKSGNASIDLITVLISSNSITQAKILLNEHIAEMKQTAQKEQQYVQQLEQLQATNEQLTKELNNLQKMNLDLKQKEIEIKEKEINSKIKIANDQMEAKKEEIQNKATIEQNRNELEKAQLLFGKGSEKEIKNL